MASETIDVDGTEVPAKQIRDAVEDYEAGNDVAESGDVLVADDRDDDNWVNVYFNGDYSGSYSAPDLKERAEDALQTFEQIENSVDAAVYVSDDGAVFRLGGDGGTTAPADDVVSAVKDVATPENGVEGRTVNGLTVKERGWAPWANSPKVEFSDGERTQQIPPSKVLSALK